MPVRRLSPEANLLAELAQTLERGGAASEVGIITPTKRLGLWLAAELCPEDGAVVPPRLFNLDDFLTEFAARPETDPRVLPDMEAEMVLAQMIRSGEYRHLRLGHEHEARQFFTETVDQSVTAPFEALRERLEAETVLAEGGLAEMGERFAELEDLHRRFHLWMEEVDTWTAALRQRALVERIAARFDRSPPPFPALYMVGFTSLTAVHLPWLRVLGRWEGFHLWVSEDPGDPTAAGAGASPLQAIVEMTDA